MIRNVSFIGACLSVVTMFSSPVHADDLGRIFGTIAGEIMKEQLRQQRAQPQPVPQVRQRQSQPRATPRASAQPQRAARPTAPSPQQPQMTLDQRMAVQRALAQAGHYFGEIDGILGSGSRRAIANWQAAMGAEATGYLRQQQAEALIATAPLPVTASAAPMIAPSAQTAPPFPAAAEAATGSLNVPPQVPATPAEMQYADLVHLVLMSDTAAYETEAETLAVPYLAAVASVEDCGEMRAVRMAADEFTIRDMDRQAVQLFRQALAELPGKPRRIEKPITESLYLTSYDFERGGFPLAEQTGRYGTSILRPGTLLEKVDSQARAACQWFSTGEFSRIEIAHDGVAGMDFLPMTEEEARAFRAGGGDTATLQATLVIEPRAQGRGPLIGTVTGAVLTDPVTGRILWQQEETAAGAEASQPDATELGYPLIAQLAAPLIEPMLSDDDLREAAAGYFAIHAATIVNGNTPPGSPLPIESIRGQDPQVIAATQLPALRERLGRPGPDMPLTVVFRQLTSAHFESGKGLILTPDMSDADPDQGRRISLHDLLPRQYGRDDDFISVATRRTLSDIVLEMDRRMTVAPLPMTPEEAAQRGLVGGPGLGIELDWTMQITDLRPAEEQLVLDVALTGLTVRGAEDGTVILEAAAEDFPSLAALRQQADAALGLDASPDSVRPLSEGARFGAEMTDLLQLRYAPDSVDDAMIERMMLTRHAFEARIRDGVPEGGRFFRDLDTPPDAEARTARRAEFRTWSEARARTLPTRMTLHLPVLRGGGELRAPWQRSGRSDATQWICNGAEEGTAQSAICDYLTAAWLAPEPLLFLSDRYSQGPRSGLRTSCRRDDVYCDAINNAQQALRQVGRGPTEMVRLDSLPTLPADLRPMSDDMVIQIDVEPVAGTMVDVPPPSIWTAALQTANDFGLEHGISEIGAPLPAEPGNAFLLVDAKAIAARLVDGASGAVLGDLVLAAAAPPPAELLEGPPSQMTGTDVLGIRLGTAFDEADRIIREHMEVGKVLTADRATQLGGAEMGLQAYSSGRIYVSADETEMIAVFDEPPAAPNRIVGLWRVLRLPQGSVNARDLQATLINKYGDPRATEETNLAFMSKGVIWAWHDPVDRGCTELVSERQPDLWREQAGGPGWSPSFMPEESLPVLEHDSLFKRLTGDPLEITNFCPAVLGVRLASYDGRVKQQPAGDEIVTWLSDNRAYARLYLESKQAPPPPAEPVAVGGAPIKF